MNRMVEVYMEEISEFSGDDVALAERAKEIAKSLESLGVPDKDKAPLVAVIQAKLQEKLPVSEIKNLLNMKSETALANDFKSICAGYVWNALSDKLLRIATGEMLSEKTFNVLYVKLLNDERKAFDADAKLVSNAFAVANSQGYFRVVDGTGYDPREAAEYVDDGRKLINTYRPDLLPDVPDVLSDGDIAAIARIENHFNILFPNPTHANNILNFVAHNVQQPGQKIRKSVLIKGVQGDGKTTIATLLEATMGRRNVNQLTGTTLVESSFTAWACGFAVVVIEELRIAGKNRFVVTDKLKPFQSNDRIEIHPKGKDPFTINNTTNFLEFTNHEDALPYEEGDRRNEIYFTCFRDRAELQDKFGNAEDYFAALNAAITEHAGALRGWLLSRDLSKFNRHAGAIKTEFAETMRRSGFSEEQDIANSIIESVRLGAKVRGVGRNVISAAHLMTAVTANGGGGEPCPYKITTMLKSLGFKQLERMRWDNQLTRIWYRKAPATLAGDQLKKEALNKLDETVTAQKLKVAA